MVSSMEKPPGLQVGLGASLAASWRTFIHDLSGNYRPERHYMRGPGPKWREKHMSAAPDAAAGHSASPLYPQGIPA